MSVPASHAGTRPEPDLAPAPLPVRSARQRPGSATCTSSLVLGAVDTAPGCARDVTRDALAQWGLRHLAEDAAAIASELVANAVAASRRVTPLDAAPLAVTLWLTVRDRELCIRVWDPEFTPPPRDHEPGLWEESGRGLVIVRALSHRWDWYPTVNGGKFVWAVMRTDALPPGE